jgi:hypothetical protein
LVCQVDLRARPITNRRAHESPLAPSPPPRVTLFDLPGRVCSFPACLSCLPRGILVLRCLGGASSTPASAPTNDKISRRRDSKLDRPSHFPAPLMSSSCLPADSGRDPIILFEVTLSPPALVLPLASSWLSAHQHDHQRPTRDLPTLSSVVPFKFFFPRAIYAVSISAEIKNIDSLSPLYSVPIPST